MIVACVGCSFQKPPQATIVVNADRKPTSHAVLVMPTKCVSYAHAQACTPTSWQTDEEQRRQGKLESSFGFYIDPALRLKLELAGFTLAEASAMRLSTADRVDTNEQSTVTETGGTVAELSLEDLRTVATSLGLTSLLLPELTIRPAEYGTLKGELVVTLVDVASMSPRWTVKCSETLFSVDESSNRIANCAGNGVLAVLAPENLIGKAL